MTFLVTLKPTHIVVLFYDTKDVHSRLKRLFHLPLFTEFCRSYTDRISNIKPIPRFQWNLLIGQMMSTILEKLDTCFFRVLSTTFHTEFLQHIHPSIVFSYSERPIMYSILDTFYIQPWTENNRLKSILYSRFTKPLIKDCICSLCRNFYIF